MDTGRQQNLEEEAGRDFSLLLASSGSYVAAAAEDGGQDGATSSDMLQQPPSCQQLPAASQLQPSPSSPHACMLTFLNHTGRGPPSLTEEIQQGSPRGKWQECMIFLTGHPSLHPVSLSPRQMTLEGIRHGLGRQAATTHCTHTHTRNPSAPVSKERRDAHAWGRPETLPLSLHTDRDLLYLYFTCSVCASSGSMACTWEAAVLGMACAWEEEEEESSCLLIHTHSPCMAWLAWHGQPPACHQPPQFPPTDLPPTYHACLRVIVHSPRSDVLSPIILWALPILNTCFVHREDQHGRCQTFCLCWHCMHSKRRGGGGGGGRRGHPESLI